MAEKLFTQDELNKIVMSRLRRERDRFIREFEDSLKRCMAAVHLTLYQEMCAMKRISENGGEPFGEFFQGIKKPVRDKKRDMAADMKDTLLSEEKIKPHLKERTPMSQTENPAQAKSPAGEVTDND